MTEGPMSPEELSRRVRWNDEWRHGAYQHDYAALQAQVLTLESDIRDSLEELKIGVTQINAHLAALNGSVARHEQQLAGLSELGPTRLIADNEEAHDRLDKSDQRIRERVETLEKAQSSEAAVELYKDRLKAQRLIIVGLLITLGIGLGGFLLQYALSHTP